MIKEQKILFEIDMTKSELKDFVKDIIDKEVKEKIKNNDIVTEKKVRDVVKELLKKHYKTLWTKSMYFTEDL